MRKSVVTVLEPTSPVYDLTTVDAVNAALGITGNTAADGIMGEKITTVSRMISELCDRTFALLTVSESFRMSFYDPTKGLNLWQFPVKELTSITVGGQTVDATSYEIDMDAGLLWLVPGMWSWMYPPVNSHWSGEVVLQYSGGYNLPDEAPALLAQGCIETLRWQHFSANRDPSIRSTTHGDTTVAYGDYYNRFRYAAAGKGGAAPASSILPPNATEMIQNYMRLQV
jgi:hypothetical protein